MAAYYNEIDKHAAAWLRELIKEGHIAPGEVDERSIKDVQPDDLNGFKQVHFFAGIGGWSLALRLAGWPDDAAVWTGSCPCQPFSSAGKRKGAEDERHLWPAMHRLISERRPGVVFGEQVASAIGHGWLDGVFADLEREAYSCGAVVLGAHSVCAPHIRQRLWWLAESTVAGSRTQSASNEESESGRSEPRREGVGIAGGLADAKCSRARSVARRMGANECRTEGSKSQSRQSPKGIVDGCATNRLGNAGGSGPQERIGDGRIQRGPVGADSWQTAELASCRDGRARRFEPGSFPLAHGVSNRVVKLRGYGNAIVPQVAAEFIQAYLEAKAELT